MIKISCLLLAAGESKRMGAANKLLLPIFSFESGEADQSFLRRSASATLLRRSAQEILKFPFDQVLVVTGHETEAIELEVCDLDLNTVYNPDFKTGMHSSIRRGLEALADLKDLDQGESSSPENKSSPSEDDGFMVVLSDQPRLGHAIVAQVAEKFRQTHGPRIVYPVLQGKQGHPVLISNHFVNEILNETDGDHGCGYLFKRHPEFLYPLAVDDPSILIDLDTPEQIRDFQAGL